MEIKDLYLDDDIKKQLGYIIRETRRIKLIECKNADLIENNPYTKENFCDNNNLCHYHTLTKLESDLIKEETIYHVLLKKLDLYYQVSPEEHKRQMEYIEKITINILNAGEFINDDLARIIKKEIDQIVYKENIISHYYIKLLKLFINLQLLTKVEDTEIEELVNFIDFYHGIHHGIAMQCLGIYYLNKLETEKAKKYFLEVKDIYENYNISKGLISSYLIAIHVYTNNYYESVPLCNEMEVFYNETQNYKRLMHVYNYLSDYYFLINAHDVAKDYFNKANEIINKDETLIRYKFALYYNWGFRCFKEFRLEEALENFLTSLSLCTNRINKIQIIDFILIVMTKLSYPQEELFKYYNEGEKYIEFSNEINRNIFKYFRFKFKKSKYYRKFAIEKVIPLLSEDRSKTEILLFFYEDLYK